ncbi:hypothetical protein QE152_g7805 [Popillia japonica]|uniref:Uncharacterized protein n=1 Tax=Popillia japonica TaxID=7064 RepID=A0AAW1ME18_POPJA
MGRNSFAEPRIDWLWKLFPLNLLEEMSGSSSEKKKIAVNICLLSAKFVVYLRRKDMKHSTSQSNNELN